MLPQHYRVGVMLANGNLCYVVPQCQALLYGPRVLALTERDLELLRLPQHLKHLGF
jgi:hypothetical protein